jgi:hypothetical protein
MKTTEKARTTKKDMRWRRSSGGAFGESAEEVVEREMRGDAREESVRAGARKTGAVPSEKEEGDRNLDRTVFMSWRPGG